MGNEFLKGSDGSFEVECPFLETGTNLGGLAPVIQIGEFGEAILESADRTCQTDVSMRGPGVPIEGLGGIEGPLKFAVEAMKGDVIGD
jgi:hypothetical protein